MGGLATEITCCDVHIIFSALAVGDPHAKVPYCELKPSSIMGLPAHVHLRHLSAMP